MVAAWCAQIHRLLVEFVSSSPTSHPVNINLIKDAQYFPESHATLNNHPSYNFSPAGYTGNTRRLRLHPLSVLAETTFSGSSQFFRLTWTSNSSAALCPLSSRRFSRQRRPKSALVLIAAMQAPCHPLVLHLLCLSLSSNSLRFPIMISRRSSFCELPWAAAFREALGPFSSWDNSCPGARTPPDQDWEPCSHCCVPLPLSYQEKPKGSSLFLQSLQNLRLHVNTGCTSGKFQ